jgi:uncharacterized protein YfaP (DUF2135 family)
MSRHSKPCRVDYGIASDGRTSTYYRVGTGSIAVEVREERNRVREYIQFMGTVQIEYGIKNFVDVR